MSFDLNEFEGSEYDQFEIEALQEISNIGVGHSATALSELLHRKVDMSIPYVRLLDLNEVGINIAGAVDNVVIGILMDTMENDKLLNYLLIFDEESAKNILNILRTRKPPENLNELDDVGRSIIKETGNILLLHMISAINSFIESKWEPTVPSMSIDMIGSMIQEVVGRMNNPSEKFLQVQCDVFTEVVKIKGEMFIVPSKDGLQLLMDRLYGEGWREHV